MDEMKRPRRKKFGDLIRELDDEKRLYPSLDEAAESIKHLSESSQEPAVVIPITQTGLKQDSQAPGRTSSHSPAQTSGQTPDRSASQSLTHPNTHPLTQSNTHPLSRTPTRTPDHPVSHPVTQPPVRPRTFVDIEITNSLAALTEAQFKILATIIEHPTRRLAYKELSQLTGIAKETVRGSVTSMSRQGILQKKPDRFGRFQGLKFSVPDTIISSYKTVEHPLKQAVSRSVGHTVAHSSTRSPTHSPTPSHSIDDDSLCSNRNHHLDDNQLHEMYPNLWSFGFHYQHLEQVEAAWRMKKIDLELLHDSLEMADWDVEKHPDKFHTGACAYVIASLKRGPYSKPAGFKFQREIAAEMSKAADENVKRLYEESLQLRFMQWWAELSEDERKQIDHECKAHLATRDENKSEMRLNYYKNARKRPHG